MAESWRTTKKIIRNAIYKGDQLTVVIPLSPPNRVSEETLKIKSL